MSNIFISDHLESDAIFLQESEMLFGKGFANKAESLTAG